tara:strand:+ start:419 stop:763 length:345 start_codon:yes stop_codon:yes gene_type:complete
MKALLRLFYKKTDLQKAVEGNFTKTSVSSVVMFVGVDESENLYIAKMCLKLYDYSRTELQSYIDYLEIEMKSHIEWREERKKQRLFLSQSGLGNWAGTLFSYEKMIKLLTLKLK